MSTLSHVWNLQTTFFCLVRTIGFVNSYILLLVIKSVPIKQGYASLIIRWFDNWISKKRPEYRINEGQQQWLNRFRNQTPFYSFNTTRSWYRCRMLKMLYNQMKYVIHHFNDNFFTGESIPCKKKIISWKNHPQSKQIVKKIIEYNNVGKSF